MFSNLSHHIMSIRDSLLLNRNFAFLWAEEVLSQACDYIFTTILVLWITTIIARSETWAPLAIGGVFLSVSISSLLIASVAGVFVDRYDKRYMMLCMNALSTLLMFCFLRVAVAFINVLATPLILLATPNDLISVSSP